MKNANDELPISFQNQVLKKLGPPIMTNLYYGTVKQLLERVASVMVDRESTEHLIDFVKEALEDGPIVEELGLGYIEGESLDRVGQSEAFTSAVC